MTGPSKSPIKSGRSTTSTDSKGNDEPLGVPAPVSPTGVKLLPKKNSKDAEAVAVTARSTQHRPKLPRALSADSRHSIFKSKSKIASLPCSRTSEAPAEAATDPASGGAATQAPEGAPATEAVFEQASWIDARDGYQLMATHLWRLFKRDSLFGEGNDATGVEPPSGVAIRYGKAQYVVCPSNEERLDDFCKSIAVLNTEAAMTLTSAVVAAITTRLAPSTTHVPITPSQNIQVVDTMTGLAGARKAQNACFIRTENTLVVWAVQIEILHERAQDLEDKMMAFVWKSSYYNNSNNLMVATMGTVAATPALASHSASSPTASTPSSNPSSPTSSSFSSFSSVASFAALNQSNFEKGHRNHQRSYTKDRTPFKSHSTATSIDSILGAVNSTSKDDAIDGLPEVPASLAKEALGANGHLRHAAFSALNTNSYFNEVGSQHLESLEHGLSSASAKHGSSGRATSMRSQTEAAKLATWHSKGSVSESLVSPSASYPSSLSSSDEKVKNVEDGTENVENERDHERQDIEYEQRPLSYLAPLQHGLAVALDILICFLFTSRLFQHCLDDGNWTRMALTPIMFIMFPVILFFCDNIIGIIMQIFGPVNQLHQNSLYFSGKAPVRKLTGDLPHITIQMPVYKESLQGVLMPTIESVKKAITTYELQGGTAGIVVSEDGMLLVDEQEKKLRKEFYERNNVGWVARPGHNKDGYVRKGRFKKASNLNFTCHLAVAVEQMMGEERPKTIAEVKQFRSDPLYLKSTRADGQAKEEEQETEKENEMIEGWQPSELLGAEDWTDADESELYRRCLEACLPRMHRLAQAKGDIRIGELILMIDCDTRVPEDCLLDAATEMTLCPDIGVLQHCSGVMLVSDSYFELCIAFFTRLVNFAISFTVANGDVAPFMGHNAILRWSAMQEAAFVDTEDGVRKYWSESHVSEDFDMALRLLMSGYITRWATYSNNGFEEGVSLTCDDELNRWQKYAFGCSELILHRLWQWPYKGPFTPLFKTFLKSSAPIHYKFSACSYIFSYYAIGAAFPMTWALYLVEGWFYPVLDPSFLTPFKIWVAVVVVFTIGGNVGQIIARYRAKVDSLWNLVKEHATWMPAMFIFFGGLSYHVATALLSHPLGIDMTWGATNKDLADSNFFLEVPLIWKRFWKVIVLCLLTIAAVVVLQTTVSVPLNWSIQGFFTYWPLLLTAIAHLIYPVVLNPALLRFSF